MLPFLAIQHGVLVPVFSDGKLTTVFVLTFEGRGATVTYTIARNKLQVYVVICICKCEPCKQTRLGRRRKFVII